MHAANREVKKEQSSFVHVRADFFSRGVGRVPLHPDMVAHGPLLLIALLPVALTLRHAAVQPLALRTPRSSAPRRPLLLASAVAGANATGNLLFGDEASEATDFSEATGEILPPQVVTSSFTTTVTAALIAFCTAFAMLFRRFEKWSFQDALYYTTTTAATVGFGDVRPVTSAGRVLTCALASIGVGLFGGLLSATLGELLKNDERAHPGVRPQLVQGFALLVFGVLGLRACEGGRVGWAPTTYCILGTLTTSGIGDVVPTSAAARWFISFYCVRAHARAREREPHTADWLSCLAPAG